MKSIWADSHNILHHPLVVGEANKLRTALKTEHLLNDQVIEKLLSLLSLESTLQRSCYHADDIPLRSPPSKTNPPSPIARPTSLSHMRDSATDNVPLTTPIRGASRYGPIQRPTTSSTSTATSSPGPATPATLADSRSASPVAKSPSLGSISRPRSASTSSSKSSIASSMRPATPPPTASLWPESTASGFVPTLYPGASMWRGDEHACQARKAIDDNVSAVEEEEGEELLPPLGGDMDLAEMVW